MSGTQIFVVLSTARGCKTLSIKRDNIFTCVLYNLSKPMSETLKDKTDFRKVAYLFVCQNIYQYFAQRLGLCVTDC